MKIIHFTDPKIGGVLKLDADVTLASGEYAQFDIIRPVTSDLTNTLGLSVQITKAGAVIAYALFNGNWIQVKQVQVISLGHITITRADVFAWSITAVSSADAALNKTIVIDHQEDFLSELLSSATVTTERASQLTVDLYASSLTSLTNLVIEADRNAWEQ